MISMNSLKKIIGTTILFFLLCGSVSAEVRISSLPQPSPTAKLRVFVVTVTTESKALTKHSVFWPVSPEEMDRRHKQSINERLKRQGIYEVVSPDDVQVVLGDQTIAGWEWKARDWALAREAGKALHADYVIMIERSRVLHLQFDTKLVNLNNGKQFEASDYIPSAMLRQMTRDQGKQAGAEVFKIQFRQIFQEAKSDLLQTAIQKGKAVAKEPLPPVKLQQPLNHPEDPVAVSPTKEKPSQTLPAQTDNAQKTPVKAVTPGQTVRDSKISEKQLTFEKELEKSLAPEDKKTDHQRLVVYDFDAAERMKVVGLILTEALREELHNSGGFVLVNRENILKIMDEYKLQQSGLVDEKQAIKVGKWLAANEAVTGNLAMLGNTSILQVKRIDIQTLGNIALGSLKCPAGREDELLDRMPQLARKLAQSK